MLPMILVSYVQEELETGDKVTALQQLVSPYGKVKSCYQ
jgi:hypothetical protein